MKFILELNPLTIPNGFSVVKNAGILFRKKINIHMEEPESHNHKKMKKVYFKENKQIFY